MVGATWSPCRCARSGEPSANAQDPPPAFAGLQLAHIYSHPQSGATVKNNNKTNGMPAKTADQMGSVDADIAVPTAAEPDMVQAVQAMLTTVLRHRRTKFDDAAVRHLALLLDLQRQHTQIMNARDKSRDEASMALATRLEATAAPFLAVLDEIKVLTTQAVIDDIRALVTSIQPPGLTPRKRSWHSFAAEVFQAFDQSVQGQGKVSRAAERFVVAAMEMAGYTVTEAAVQKALTRKA